MKSILFLFWALLVLFGSVFAEFYDVSAPAYIAPDGVGAVAGYVLDGSGDPVEDANVTITYDGGETSADSDENGLFTLPFAAPSSLGESTANLTNNYSVSDNIILYYFITNISSVEFSVLNAPDFSPGSSFLLNVTIFNNNSEALVAYPASSITFDVFEANGPEQEWDIEALSSESDADGSIVYNISISENATSSAYVIVVDGGIGTFMFALKFDEVGLEFIVGSETEGGQFSNYFAPDETVVLVAKLRDPDSGEVITDATISAVVKLPNGSTDTVSLEANDDISGRYNSTFSTTSQNGVYFVEVTATLDGGEQYNRFIGFSVGSFFAELAPAFQKEGKVFEFGNMKGVQTGGEAPFYLLVRNQFTDNLLNGSPDGSGDADINCSAISLLSLTRVQNNTDYTSQVSASFNASQTERFMGGIDVCYITFNAPDDTGIYKLAVLVDINGTNYTAEGWIPVQSYYLDIFSISNFGDGEGGSEERMMLIRPGSNVTFKFRAYYLNGTEVDPGLIDSLQAIELEHMPSRTVYEPPDNLLVYGPDESENTIIITSPSDNTDMFRFVGIADVDGEEVTGATMFFSKYVVGNLQPVNPDGREISPEISCSGTVNFGGRIMNAETGQVASGVSIHAVPYEAREQETGKNVLGCFNITQTISSNSTPLNVQTTIVFNPSCPFNGEYFFLANLSFVDVNSQPRQDVIPGWFRCTVLKADVNMKSLGSNQYGPVSSQKCVNISISNPRYSDETPLDNATAEILSMSIFSKETFGPPEEAYSDVLLQSVMVDDEMPSIVACPQNFSRQKWSESEGFLDFKIELCTNSTCDVFRRGIPVMGGSSSQIWFHNQPSSVNSRELYSNSNTTFRFKIHSNVTDETPGTNITVQINVMGTNPKTLQIVNTAKLNDTWDEEADADSGGSELWEVDATIPADLPKGGAEIKLCAKGSSGAKSCTIYFANVGGNIRVSSPRAELVLGNVTGESSALAQGWNLTWLNATFDLSGYQFGEFESCIADNLTILSFGPDGPTEELINDEFSVLMAENNSNEWVVFLYNKTFGDPYDPNGYIVRMAGGDLSEIAMPAGLYLLETFDCGRAMVIATSSDARADHVGDYQEGSEFDIYLVAKTGNGLPLSDLTANITKIFLEGNNFGGVGEQIFDYTVTPGTTNQDGLAVVRLNISEPGRLLLYWKVNGSDVAEVADQSTALRTSIRSFMVWGMVPEYLPNNTVTLNNYSFGLPEGIFNGSMDNFMNTSELRWFFYNNTAETLLISNDSLDPMSDAIPCLINEFDQSPSVFKCNISAMYHLIDSEQVFYIGANLSVNDSVKKFGFFQLPSGLEQPSISNCSAPIYLSLCVQEFGDVPTRIPGANITLSMMKFEPPNPPEEVSLTVQHPITGQNVSVLQTGPSGCVAFYINPPDDGWPSSGGGQANIMANVIAIVDSEERSEQQQILPPMMCED